MSIQKKSDARNSYSKKDVDTTFMRIKDDYMRSGQLKSGYILQIATNNQYVLAYDIFPNSTDLKTFVSFLSTIKANYFDYLNILSRLTIKGAKKIIKQSCTNSKGSL